MALSDRDIIITPNRGASSEPIITLRGADAASSATMVMRVINSGTVSTLSFEGTAGQLFAVSDTFAGTIFSVNDVSGIPSIEVLDSGEIKLAEYNGFVNIKGTTNATSVNSGVLRVAGGVGIAQDVYIGGTLNVTGTLNAAVIAGSITNAANVAVTNDPSNSATMYPTFVSATSGNQAIRIDSTGLVWIPSTNRLGIGTAEPLAPLQIGAKTIENTFNNTRLILAHGASTEAPASGNPTSVPSVGIEFNRYWSGGNDANRNMGGIYSYGVSNWGSGIYMSTRPVGSGGTPVIRMVVNHVGNVGIGSVEPLTKLHVEETGADIIGGNAVRASTMKGITLNNTNNDNSSVGVWFGTGPGSHWSGISGQRTNSAANWGTDLRFYTHEDATNDLTFSRERMRISSAGNVGIGTNAPTAKLEINPSDGGDARSIQTFFNTSAVYNPAAAGTANRVVTGLRFNWYSENWQIGAGRGGGTDIQELSFSRNGTAHIIINSSGFLGIGKTVPTTRLHVFRDGLANNTVNPLITLDGKFNVTTVDNNDIVAIASRIENNAGGSQTTNIIGSGYQATYNTLLLQPSGGNVGVNNINPGRTLDVTGVTNVSSHITQGALISRPNVSWGASGTSTGAVVIRFPGGSGNYGMVHIVIDIYTYDGENASTIIIGGHNWNGSWYNFGATRIGAFSKGVRVAFKDGQYAVVLGTNTSTWSYGQVVVRKIQNGSYYSGVMDLGGTYTIAQDAAAESYSYISGNLITTGSAGGGGWNSGNDGTGSGLDADLLDGLDSTAFLRRDVSNSMFAGQGSQLSFENQGTFFRFAFNELRFYDWNNGIDIFGLNEHAYATTSMRAPIFYDRDNTAYYLDPAATGKAMLVNGNIELTARSESWAEGIRINVPTAGTWGGIRINRSGASGPGNWAIGYTGLNSTNDLTFYSGTTNTIQVNLDHSANLSSIGSMRAPIFYDSNDTAYYLDPNADLSLRVYGEISNSNYVPGNLQPGALNIGRTDLNYNWAGGWSNDVRTGILANCLNNWEFAIHDSGERVVSPFAFFGGTGGQYLEMGRDIGWGTMPIIATNSFRAPIFYDQNNTAFYTDPASTSVVNNLTVNGTLTYTGSIAAGVDFARRLDNHTRTAFTVGGNASTFYPVVFQLGSGATAQQYGEFMIERGGYDDPGFTGVNFSTMNARFSHKASGWGFGSTYENCEALYQNVQLIANWQQVSESSRMIIWLRGATIYHFYNIVGNTTLVNANAAGGNIVESNPAFYTYTFTPTTTVNAKAQHSKYFNGGAFFDGNNRAFSLGVGTNASGTDGRLDVTADIRAPIYYDSNNTAFYTDPASTSNIGRLLATWSGQQGHIIRRTDNPGTNGVTLLVQNDFGNNSWGIVSEFRVNSAGADSPSILFSQATNANTWTMGFGFADTDTFRIKHDHGYRNGGWGTTDLTIDRSGNVTAFGSSRAPIFYDSANTAYYADFNNGTTSVNQLGNTVYNQHGRGPTGLYSASRLQLLFSMGPAYQLAADGTTAGNLYGVAWSHPNAGAIGGANNLASHGMLILENGAFRGAWGGGRLVTTADIRGTLFYDYNNTAFYVDPASTSVFNTINATTINATISGNASSATSATSATFVSWRGRISAEIGRNAYASGVYTYSTFTSANAGGNPPLTYPEIIAWGGGASGSIQIAGDWISTTSTPLRVRSLRDCCQDWSSWSSIATSNESFTNNVDLRAPIFYDSNNTAYFTDPSSTSNLFNLQITGASNKYLYINPGNGYEAMVRYNGGSGSGWYVGKRISSQVVGTESFHFYSEAAGQTVGGIDTSGNIFARDSMRAPIFYDNNDTSYYVNPNTESRLNRLRVGPYAGSVSAGNVTGLELVNNGGTGDSNVAAMSFHCAGQYAVHLHLRADSYFGMGGWSASSWRWYVQASTGNMTAAGEVTAYSDPRLKENIEKIASPLERISKLSGVKFKWKEISVIGNPGSYDYGVIADEVEEQFPELVYDSAYDAPEGDKYKTVAYSKFVPILIEAIKEQQTTIDQLRAEMQELKEFVKQSLGK